MRIPHLTAKVLLLILMMPSAIWAQAGQGTSSWNATGQCGAWNAEQGLIMTSAGCGQNSLATLAPQYSQSAQGFDRWLQMNRSSFLCKTDQKPTMPTDSGDYLLWACGMDKCWAGLSKNCPQYNPPPPMVASSYNEDSSGNIILQNTLGSAQITPHGGIMAASDVVTGGDVVASGSIVATGDVQVKGDVRATGAVQIGYGVNCDSAAAGEIRYNKGIFEGCNGTDWVKLSSGIRAYQKQGGEGVALACGVGETMTQCYAIAPNNQICPGINITSYAPGTSNAMYTCTAPTCPGRFHNVAVCLRG